MGQVRKLASRFNILLGVIGSLLSVVGVITFFDEESLGLRLAIVAGIFLLTFLLSVVFSAIEEKREQNIRSGFIGDKSILVQENRKFLLNMYKSQEYNDVCNVGAVMGRVFYVAAAYRSRIDIGQIVFKSAATLGRHKVCASSLLDTGWTILLLKNNKVSTMTHGGVEYNSPDDYFRKSIEYGQKAGDNSIVSKAYRHLSGYYLTIGDFQQYAECRALSEEWFQKLPEGTDKDVLKANLFYVDAETAFMKKDYARAMELCVQADKAKRGVDEESREIRYYSQRGKIEYVLGDIGAAKELFLKGLDYSQRLKRLDEITKNTYGYAICLMLDGQKQEAEKRVRTMKAEYGDIPLFISDEFFVKEYHRVYTNHNTISGGGCNA